MNNSRWYWRTIAALGLVCSAVVCAAWTQAQVGGDPKGTAQTRPAERPAAIDERATPTNGSKTADAPRPKSEAPQNPDDSRRPRSRASEHHGGWLGVYVAEASENKAVSGAQISQVFPSSPAARAGFRAGDVITQVNDQKVADPQSFISAIDALPPGTKTTFAVQRNSQAVKLTATLGENFWAIRGQDEDYDRGADGMRGRGSHEEYPIYALELEHNRRMAEQHQRMEQMLLELKEEVHQLREELKTRK